MERVNSLDAVRGLAALCVAIAHAAHIWFMPLLGAPHPAMRFFSSLATWSVAAFFALSGFAIALSVHRQGRAFDLQRFILARVWRIVPPLYAAIALALACIAIIHGLGLYGSHGFRLPGDIDLVRDEVDMHWSTIPSMLTLTFNVPWTGGYLPILGPLWTLSYEFWTYMVAGLACLGFIRRSPLAVAGAAAATVMFCLSQNPLWLTFGLVWSAGFTIGWTFAERTPQHVAWCGLVIFLGLAAAGTIVLWRGPDLLVDPYTKFTGRVVYVGVGCAMAGLIGLLARLRCPSMISALGGMSYSLYLMHFPLCILCFSVIRPHLPASLAGHLIGASISLVVAVSVSVAAARFVENRARMQGIIRTARIPLPFAPPSRN